jgi:hypothetical protein
VGFFSNIVRDSQRPPPTVKSVPHGTDPHSGGEATPVLPSESRPLGLEAPALTLADKPDVASGPAIREPDAGHESKALPAEPPARQAAGPSPLEHNRTKGPAQSNDGRIIPPKPAAQRQTDRPRRRTATSQPSPDQANTLDVAVSTGTAPTEVKEAVLEAPIANRQSQSARESSGRTPESGPVEKIVGDETAGRPSQSPQSLPPPSASPPATLSTLTADDDGSVSAKPAPDRKRGDIPSPVEAIPHPSELLEIPPPRRSTTMPGAPDPLPPTAAIPRSLAQEQSDTLPESGDDLGPTPELHIAAARPAVPIRIESFAAPPPFQGQGEGGADWAPSQAVQTPDAPPEGPRVQIGLLEVVVLAPANAPKGMHVANKARSSIASRHYLRNM